MVTKKKVFLIWAIIILVTLVALGRLIYIVQQFGPALPFLDQYNFYQGFINHLSWSELFFWQHGQHRQGLGGPLQYWLLEATQWSNNAVAYAIIFVLLLSASLALWIKLHFFEKKLSLFDCVIPIMFLNSNQYETLIAASNLSPQTLPLLLCIIASGCCFIKSNWKRSLLLGTIGFIGLFTGYGYHLFSAIMVITFLECLKSILLKDKNKFFSCIMLCGIMILGALLFMYHFKWQTSVSCYNFPAGPVYRYFLFIGLMPAKFFGVSYLRNPGLATFASISILIGLITLGIFLCKRFLTSSDPKSRAILLLIGFSTSFAMLCSIGRICSGLLAAGSSRYMTIVIPSIFGLYLLSIIIPQRKLRIIASSILIILCLAGYMPFKLSDRTSLVEFGAQQKKWQECFIKGNNATICNQESNIPMCDDPNQQQKVLDYLKNNKLSIFKTLN